MDILLFTFNEISAANGISKKIEYQKKAFIHNGENVHLMHVEKCDSKIVLYIDNKKICHFKNNLFWTLKILSFKSILSFLENSEIKLVYVRYNQYSSPAIFSLFKSIRKMGVKILFEIPTYPYDDEFKTIKQKFFLFWERYWRKKVAKCIDFVVTFTNFEYIWNIPTIQIKNGVNFDEISMKDENRLIKDRMELIAVAGLSFWHGFDRVLEGIRLYNENSNSTHVHLTIVGKGDIKVFNALVALADKYKLQDSVTFCGEVFGEDLDLIFQKADIAIGCLGCHRKNIVEVSSLKNVEYAARGIPFIYSEKNSDFDRMLYVKKEIADDSPINIAELVEWRRNIMMQPIEIRTTVSDVLSWNKQMKKVLL